MRKEKKKLGLTFNQQMVLSVLLNAGAVPLIDDQTYTTSAATTPSSANNPEYVHFLEELVGELSGVFATWVHQNPPPSSPTSLADMYHQRTNTCRSTTTTGNEPFSSILSLSLSFSGELNSFQLLDWNYPAVKRLQLRLGDLPPNKFSLFWVGPCISLLLSI